MNNNIIKKELEELEDAISKAKEAGYEIDEMKIRLVVKDGYYFHEKALFLIENGQLRFYQLEKPLSEERIKIFEKNPESIKDFEEVRSGQPLGINKGVAFDDKFLFLVGKESVEMYMIQKSEED